MRKHSGTAAAVAERAETIEPDAAANRPRAPVNDDTEEGIRWTLQQGFVRRLDLGSESIVSRGQLSALRGRVFYADGRRPQFLSASGDFADEDEHDSVAFHLIGSIGGDPVAACRLVRLRDVSATDFESRIGDEVVERILSSLEVSRSKVAEVSRWVVDPHFRQEGLGALLIAGLWALTRHLGILVAFAWAGTRDGQARALVAMGGSPIPGVERIKSEAWDDELQALSFEVLRPATRFRSWVDRMGTRLGLRDLSWVR